MYFTYIMKFFIILCINKCINIENVFLKVLDLSTNQWRGSENLL